MKKILSYLLLLMYASVMIKPVMPTIADTFAHLLNYSAHIATVHYEDGNYHVHYEYVEAAKENSHGEVPFTNILKKDGSSNEHILMIIFKSLSTLVYSHDYLNSNILYLPLMSLRQDFRPPISFGSGV